MLRPLAVTVQEYFCIKHGDQRFFLQFEIIVNVLVCSFRFILILMLGVHGHHKCVNSFRVATVFRRQNLTSTDVRF